MNENEDILEDKLNWMNYNGYAVAYSEELGIGPLFLNIIMECINKKMSCNIIITGRPGISKSYVAWGLARLIEGLTDGGNDRFKLDQVVFKFSEFMEQVMKLKAGKPIVFDEPSYAMSKQDWYKELDKALMKTLESFRFKQHPLIIPVINKSLLNKTIRDHLIIYQVVMYDRGVGSVYELSSSQFEDKVYRNKIEDIYMNMFDYDQCQIDSCLDCPKLEDKDSCHLFRAEYERKKAGIQEERYDDTLTMAKAAESRTVTNDTLVSKIEAKQTQWIYTQKGFLEPAWIQTTLAEENHIIGLDRATTIAKKVQLKHPDLLPKRKPIQIK